ncbi:MAG: hypothetical protein RL499_1506 [Actinomycetota bacterium]
MTSTLTVTPATLLPWNAIERVLSSTAESRHCWCRWWLTTNAEYSTLTDEQRHNQAERAHATDEPRGLIALLDAEPVGWVSVAPRSDYLRLPRTRLVSDGTPDTDFTDPSIWAIVCFTVAPAHRRSGVARELLAEAIAYATAGGARRIEAYPIDTDALAATTGPASAGDLNTGTLALFVSAGFLEVSRPKAARPIVQLVTTTTDHEA